MIENILEYGNELEISGILMGNGRELRAIYFPEVNQSVPITQHLYLDHETWKDLLYQLDTLGVQGLGKTILRKSQRQIEQTVSWNVFRRDGYECCYCGNDKTPLTVDHVILWENMGDSVEDNLLSACRKCNKTRGNMDYQDWLKSEYYLKVSKNLSLDKQNRNKNFYDKASKVKLRASQRSR